MLIIHCGAFKTATTTLQESVFPNLNGIVYLGKDANAGRRCREDACTRKAQKALAEISILGSRAPFGNIPSSLEQISRALEPCISSPNTYLYSNESLLGCQSVQAPELFSPSLYGLPISILSRCSVSCEISFLVGIRQPPEDYLASRFLEIQQWRSTKNMLLLSLYDYLDQQFDIYSRYGYEKTIFFHASPVNIQRYFQSLKLKVKLMNYKKLLKSPQNMILRMAGSEDYHEGGGLEPEVKMSLRSRSHSAVKQRYLEEAYPSSKDPYGSLVSDIHSYCLTRRVF